MDPSFLWEQKDKWPNQSNVEKIYSDDPEVKKTISVHAVHNLKNFVAWILRFKINLRKASCQAFREPVKQKGSQP